MAVSKLTKVLLTSSIAISALSYAAMSEAGAGAGYIVPQLYHHMVIDVDSPPYRERIQNAESARREKHSVFGEMLPTVDASYRFGYDGRKNSQTNGYNSNFLQDTRIQLEQLIFDGFGTPYRYRGAIDEHKSMKFLRDAQKNIVALRAAQVYVDALRNNALAEASALNVAYHRQTEKKVSEILEGGGGTRVTSGDLSLARSRLHLAETVLKDLEQTRNNSEHVFTNVVGRAPTEYTGYEGVRINVPNRLDYYGATPKKLDSSRDLAPKRDKLRKKLIGMVKHEQSYLDVLRRDFGFPENKQAALNTASKHNLLLKSASERVQSKESLYNAAKGPFMPNVTGIISAGTNRNRDGFFGKEDEYQALMQISYNLFNGGSDWAALKRAEADYRAEKEIYSQQERDVKNDVEDAWTDYAFTKKKMNERMKQFKYSVQTFETYKKEFEGVTSKRSVLNLLDAENELFNSATAYLNVMYDHLTSQYALLEKMGVLGGRIEKSGLIASIK